MSKTHITDSDRKLYADLFERFQNEEYHVEFTRAELGDQYERLLSSLKRLEHIGILYLTMYDDGDTAMVELTENSCFKYVEI